MQRSVSEKILVIKLGALGDFIQALGPMAAIRKHHPHAHISLLTTAPFVRFGQDCGYVDAVICDDRPKFLDIGGWNALRKKLREAGYSRVYDLQNSDRSNLYFRLMPSSEKPEWVGTAKGASHRNTSPARTAGHAFDGHVQTLALAGITDVKIDDLSWIKDNIADFDLKKPFGLLVAGSSPQHPHKRWPAESFARVADHLHKIGIQSVLIGGKAEADVASAITSRCVHVLDLTGRTSLTQIAALAREACLAIGNDTGPMHMIAPTGCPCVVLFSGKSHAIRHKPLGPSVQILQEKNLDELPEARAIETINKMLSDLQHKASRD